jgi:hypothetical protein
VYIITATLTQLHIKSTPPPDGSQALGSEPHHIHHTRHTSKIRQIPQTQQHERLMDLRTPPSCYYDYYLHYDIIAWYIYIVTHTHTHTHTTRKAHHQIFTRSGRSSVVTGAQQESPRHRTQFFSKQSSSDDCTWYRRKEERSGSFQWYIQKWFWTGLKICYIQASIAWSLHETAICEDQASMSCQESVVCKTRTKEPDPIPVGHRTPVIRNLALNRPARS